MKVHIKGLNNCPMRNQKLKQYIEFLTQNGHEVVDDIDQSDKILIWTCGFRTDVMENSIAEVKRTDAIYGGRVIVAGCVPDIHPDYLKESFTGDVVNWKDDVAKMDVLFGSRSTSLGDISPVYVEYKKCDNVTEIQVLHPDADVCFQDQFIKLSVSEGCNYKCTYCSERIAFPKYHSYDEDEIVRACRKIVEETGEYDVMLSGDSLADYGSDTGTTLPRLISKLVAIHPNVKVAIQNFHPCGFLKFEDELVEFIKSNKIAHLAIPIQSASTRILELMNRCYTADDIDRIFTIINRLNFTRFDTHIIAGFPGETDDDFQLTMDFIRKHRPSFCLASFYMDSPIYAAGQLSNKVDREVAMNRLRQAEALFKELNIFFNSSDGEKSQHTLNRVNRRSILKRVEGSYISGGR